MTRKPTPKGECNIDKFQQWIEHVANASKKRIVLVQHKKEKDVLESLGVKNVFYYQESDYAFVDKIASKKKECILIFDADRKSNVVCEKIKSLLEQNGVKVSTRFRKLLFTSKGKSLAGILKYVHEQVATSQRLHEGVTF